LVLACFALLSGCSGQRKMMATPNHYVDEGPGLYEALAPELQSTQVPIFYITDRVPERDEQGNLGYGYERSPSQAFGRALIGLGDDITWDDLKQASRTNKRLKPVKLELLEVEEIVRATNAPIPFTEVDGKIVEEPVFVKRRAQASEVFHQAIKRQLALTPRKDVFIFVHGYHNSFEDSAFVMAEMWHFLGRIGVPIAYSWPAGHPGLFGYTYDRESSEFTVYHLRQILTLIASFPEVERVHLIGHSRGTDVVVTAVRELTIYTSPKDKAMSLSSKLFDSPRGRIGTLGADKIPETMQSTIDFSGANFSVINFSGHKEEGASGIDHSYFRKVPSVSSDLILMLRDDLDAGSPGRPLERLAPKFWQIPAGYPAKQ